MCKRYNGCIYEVILALLYTEVIPLIVEQEYLSRCNFKHTKEKKI